LLNVAGKVTSMGDEPRIYHYRAVREVPDGPTTTTIELELVNGTTFAVVVSEPLDAIATNLRQRTGIFDRGWVIAAESPPVKRYGDVLPTVFVNLDHVAKVSLTQGG
jgi:hypothetical protein